MSRLARLAMLVAATSLIAFACVPTVAPVAKKVKIVSSLPLSGQQRFETVTIVNAIRMAIEEQGGKAGTVTIEYESYDDASARRQAWDAEVEAENARKAAADPSIVAYIGTYNSGAARISIPITCQANLLMISPANTYPGLTKRVEHFTERGDPEKYYPDCRRNYARVLPADDLQAAVGARWAKELGAKRVYVLHDNEDYGKGLADVFRAEAKRIGLEEVGYEAAPRAAEFRALASKVVASGADFVYYGGIVDSNPGFLVRDLKQAKASLVLMGPDGLLGAQLLRQAGEAAVGVYVTFGGIHVSHYSGKARQWAERYRAMYAGEPSFYTAHGYEAARVVLAAIARASGRADDRAHVRDLVMATKDFDGLFGTWSFDANGDTSLTSMGGLRITRVGTDIGASLEFQKELR